MTDFKGCPYPITKHPLGFLRTETGLDLIRADLLCLLLTVPGERCLTGDTKISLANNTEVAIKDLVDTGEFWVYSYDVTSNKIVPGKATAHKTAINAELLEVTLDNEEVIRCTPNHLWLLRNGTYKRADELSPGDSLMPLYRKLNTSGYEQIYQPDIQKYRETHLCFVFENRLQGLREVVHHKDLNKKNNDPDNLQWMTCKDHKELHRQIRNLFNKKLKDDPAFYQEWLRSLKEGLKKYYESHDGHRKGARLTANTCAKLSLAKVKYYQTPEGQKQKEKFRLVALEQFKDGSPMRGKRMSEEAKCKMRGPRLSVTGSRNPAAKITEDQVIKIKTDIIEGKLTQKEIAEKYNIKISSVQNICRGRTWTSVGPSVPKIDRRKKILLNHKVKSVKKLTERADCYDLHVVQYHNFALSAGVFVHNCMLPAFGTDIAKMLFEPNDRMSADQAREIIVNAIRAWEPRVVIESINISTGNTVATSTDDEDDSDQSVMSISIRFFDPENIREVNQLDLEIPRAGG